jgi:O-6-methylguanine DNA methyltransferase
MPSLRFARADTSIGPMLVAESDLGIAAVSRSPSLSDFLAALGRRFGGSDLVPGDLDVAWLTDALSGFGSLPDVDLRGLPAFDASVYEVVRAVPPGETVTYGEVAAAIGSPGAARAVGGAMSRCPLFPAVPCHRVVRAADGWSGWGGDVALKRRLLLAERASPAPRG